ncbi:MAG: sugar transferase [Bernardetiaceae bacterium]
MYNPYFKRWIDVAASFLGLLLVSPILLWAMIWLYRANQGKVFFFQERPGKNGKPFYIIKFKTMNDRRDAKGQLLPDAERITPAGAFMRKYSLDELLQLVNVLKGEMSLVGPRPLLMEYLPLYSPTQQRRHHVRPGITGWAQVNGRNATTWPQRFENDVWYVDHLSFALDMKILWMTVRKVIYSEGISSETSATMEKFTGNECST